MINLKAMAAVSRLKESTQRSRQWLLQETLRLAVAEHTRQLTIYKTAGSDDAAKTLAGERTQVLARAIDLLKVLDV